MHPQEKQWINIWNPSLNLLYSVLFGNLNVKFSETNEHNNSNKVMHLDWFQTILPSLQSNPIYSGSVQKKVSS